MTTLLIWFLNAVVVKGIVLNSAAENVGLVAPSTLGAGTVIYFLAVTQRGNNESFLFLWFFFRVSPGGGGRVSFHGSTTPATTGKDL